MYLPNFPSSSVQTSAEPHSLFCLIENVFDNLFDCIRMILLIIEIKIVSSALFINPCNRFQGA